MFTFAANKQTLAMKKEINPEYLTCPIRQVISWAKDHFDEVVRE